MPSASGAVMSEASCTSSPRWWLTPCVRYLANAAVGIQPVPCRFGEIGQSRPGLHRGDGGPFRAQHQVVDLPLARGKTAVHGHGAGNVAGIGIAPGRRRPAAAPRPCPCGGRSSRSAESPRWAPKPQWGDRRRPRSPAPGTRSPGWRPPDTRKAPARHASHAARCASMETSREWRSRATSPGDFFMRSFAIWEEPLVTSRKGGPGL